MATCNRCGASIRFITMEKTGKAMPINPISNLDGNVAAWQRSPGRWYGDVLTAANRAEHAAAGRQFYTAHWAECPDQKPPKTDPVTEREPQESLF